MPFVGLYTRGVPSSPLTYHYNFKTFSTGVPKHFRSSAIVPSTTHLTLQLQNRWCWYAKAFQEQCHLLDYTLVGGLGSLTLTERYKVIYEHYNAKHNRHYLFNNMADALGYTGNSAICWIVHSRVSLVHHSLSITTPKLLGLVSQGCSSAICWIIHSWET